MLTSIELDFLFQVAIAFVCCYVGIAIARSSIFLKHDDGDRVPDAIGGIPILGHALEYKKNPPKFLAKQDAKVGPVFRVNLAGRQMIIIGNSPKAMKQVATLPSSIMSSELAVADIGFEQTLGKLNVFKGTNWHKAIIKEEIISGDKFSNYFTPLIRSSLASSLEKELMPMSRLCKNEGEKIEIADLFLFVRRSVTRVVLLDMIGLKMDDETEENILSELMNLQDDIEDSTAKAAVMNKRIAKLLILKPVQRKRERLENKLSKIVENSWSETSDAELKPWLRYFKNEKIDSKDASSLIIGLMFAAHKNPSIGAAQSFCFCMENCTSHEIKEMKNEASEILNNNITLEQTRIWRCVRESTRLSSHSIGAIRVALRDIDLKTEFTSYKIKKGETIGISHILPNTCNALWGETAGLFDMYRKEWDNTNNQGDLDPFKMTAFSHGVHKCPGSKIAYMIMEFTLAWLLAQDISIAQGIPEISFERATLAQRASPVSISLKRMLKENQQR